MSVTGRVSELLLDRLRKQVADRGLVVWYDPANSYRAFATGLELPGIRVIRFTDSFFRLREELEPLLECVTPDGILKPDADLPPNCILIFA